LEIICKLKLEYEHRLKAYLIKDSCLFILFGDRFDAVYSMQTILENFGNTVKDNLIQLSTQESD